MLFTNDILKITTRLKLKGWGNVCHVNTQQQQKSSVGYINIGKSRFQSKEYYQQ